MLLATACAGLIAGAEVIHFLAAALAASAAVWLKDSRSHASRCYANLDPQRPDGAVLLAALRETLSLVRRTQKPARLRLACFTPNAHPVFSLGLSRDNDLELSCDLRKSALKQPGVWLADHPLPLVLPRARSLTLVLAPCGPSRVRVSLDAGAPASSRHWLILALLASAACAFDFGWLLAAALGFALQTGLLEQQARRAPQDARIQRR